jgi:hypothetical protein
MRGKRFDDLYRVRNPKTAAEARGIMGPGYQG